MLNKVEIELKEIEKDIESIIGDNKFISFEQLDKIREFPHVYTEFNGLSGQYYNAYWYTICICDEKSDLDIESINVYVKESSSN